MYIYFFSGGPDFPPLDIKADDQLKTDWTFCFFFFCYNFFFFADMRCFFLELSKKPHHAAAANMQVNIVYGWIHLFLNSRDLYTVHNYSSVYVYQRVKQLLRYCEYSSVLLLAVCTYILLTALLATLDLPRWSGMETYEQL